MTPTRRTPRAYEKRGLLLAPVDLPSVSPALVDWLEAEFPITLSSGMADAVVQDQAEQRGRQQVIERLRSLANNQE